MKISQKQKNYITRARRTNRIKKIKRMAKTNGKKSSNIDTSIFETVCNNVVETILKREKPQEFCPHVLIGGSNFYGFLTGSFNFKRAHSLFKTPFRNKITGQAGEECFKRKNEDIVFIQPFAIHPTIPWHSAKCDFLVNYRSVFTCVEVKTFTNILNCDQFYKNVPTRELFQILIQMEIFDVTRGELVIYHFDRISKTVTLFGKIIIDKKTSLLTQELCSLSVIRYGEYLKEYFEVHNQYPNQNYYNVLEQKLVRNILASTDKATAKAKNYFHRFIETIPLLKCKYVNEMFEDLNDQREPFIPFKEMFSSHMFINTSKLERGILFDNQLKCELIESLFKKLHNPVKEHIHELLSIIKKRSSKTSFLTINEKNKMGNRNKTQNIRVINDLKAKIRDLQFRLQKKTNENKHLKQNLMAMNNLNEFQIDLTTEEKFGINGNYIFKNKSIQSSVNAANCSTKNDSKEVISISRSQKATQKK